MNPFRLCLENKKLDVIRVGSSSIGSQVFLAEVDQSKRRKPVILTSNTRAVVQVSDGNNIARAGVISDIRKENGLEQGTHDLHRPYPKQPVWQQKHRHSDKIHLQQYYSI